MTIIALLGAIIIAGYIRYEIRQGALVIGVERAKRIFRKIRNLIRTSLK